MNVRQRLEAALRSDDPLLCLRKVVQDMASEGADQNALVAELERFRAILQAEGRDTDEDVVLDVLDFVVGFCSPHLKIEYVQRSG